MNLIMKRTLRVIALTILPIVLWNTNGYCISPQEIYIWVARHMDIEYESPMPEVNYLGKEKLQKVFKNFSQKSYTQMESNYGKEYAQEIMGKYLDNVVGLFHPETGAIYVGDFLEPCRRQAVLAHELVHYFQDFKNGRIHSDDYRADDKRSLREMEAYHIENKFDKLFCGEDNQQNETLALLYWR